MAVNRNEMSITDDLLAKHISNQASDTERQRIAQWLSENDDNKKHYQELQLIWQQSGHASVISTLDEHEAWERFKIRAAAAHTEKTPNATPLTASYKWLKIAAGLLLLIGGSWAAWMMHQNNHTSVIAAVIPARTTQQPIVTANDTAHTSSKNKDHKTDPGVIAAVTHNTKSALNVRHAFSQHRAQRPFHAIVQQHQQTTVARAFPDDCRDDMKYHGPKYDSNF